MISPEPFLEILASRIEDAVGLDTDEGLRLYDTLGVELRRRCEEDWRPTRQEIRDLVYQETSQSRKPDTRPLPNVSDFFPSPILPTPFAYEVLHTRRIINEVLAPIGRHYGLPVMAGRGPRAFNTEIPVYEMGINDIDSAGIVELIRARTLPGAAVGIYGVSRIGLVFLTLPFTVAGADMSFLLLEGGSSTGSGTRIHLY